MFGKIEKPSSKELPSPAREAEYLLRRAKKNEMIKSRDHYITELLPFGDYKRVIVETSLSRKVERIGVVRVDGEEYTLIPAPSKGWNRIRGGEPEPWPEELGLEELAKSSSDRKPSHPVRKERLFVHYVSEALERKEDENRG